MLLCFFLYCRRKFNRKYLSVTRAPPFYGMNPPHFEDLFLLPLERTRSMSTRDFSEGWVNAKVLTISWRFAFFLRLNDWKIFLLDAIGDKKAIGYMPQWCKRRFWIFSFIYSKKRRKKNERKHFVDRISVFSFSPNACIQKKETLVKHKCDENNMEIANRDWYASWSSICWNGKIDENLVCLP